MSTFKVLYGKGCKTLVSWDSLVNEIILGPGMLKEMEHKIVKTRRNLKTAQDMVQEGYMLRCLMQKSITSLKYVSIHLDPNVEELLSDSHCLMHFPSANMVEWVSKGNPSQRTLKTPGIHVDCESR